mmetsp:Transcript_17386/g.55021  ORF Transcript_17386/g.55021 Transcript_17386/m.55021 type:complete len:203 (+) Transcript_17386:313-921(+)
MARLQDLLHVPGGEALRVPLPLEPEAPRRTPHALCDAARHLQPLLRRRERHGDSAAHAPAAAVRRRRHPGLRRGGQGRGSAEGGGGLEGRGGRGRAPERQDLPVPGRGGLRRQRRDLPGRHPGGQGRDAQRLRGRQALGPGRPRAAGAHVHVPRGDDAALPEAQRREPAGGRPPALLLHGPLLPPGPGDLQRGLAEALRSAG